MPRPRTTTVRDLRKSNRSRALWQVFLSGPLTRQEGGTQAGLSPATVSNLVAALAAEGGLAEGGLEGSNGGPPRPRARRGVGTRAALSPAAVSTLVAALEAEGVVVEVGLEDSNGGRPRGLLQVNPKYGYVIGVDVGETAFLVELFDLGLQVCARHTSVTDMTVLDPEDAVSHIVEGIESVIAESGVDTRAILGVGVAVPGLVEHREDAVVHGQSVGWHAAPLEAMLRRQVDLPILV